MATFYASRVCTDPNYWYELTKESLRDAEAMYQAKRYAGVVLHCHYAAEKAIKWLLAMQEKLTEQDCTHQLEQLAIKAGLKDKVGPNEWAAILKLAPMHNEASYPASLVRYQAMYEPGFAETMLKSTKIIVAAVVKEVSTLG